MRIVGGQHKGKPLVAPKGQTTRPTSDRVREAIFNILTHNDLIPSGLEGARVLDLFAGSGAMGIEALSRGAKYVLFVEDAIPARGAIRTNLENINALGTNKIFNRDATKIGPMPPGAQGPFTLVFADPPYGKGLGERAITEAIKNNWLTPGACIVLEESASSPAPNIPGTTLQDKRSYGDTKVYFLTASKTEKKT